MPINIDAELSNSDWTKTTWDIIPIAPYLEYLKTTTLTELRALARRPSYQAAPKRVTDIVETRLGRS